MTGGRASRQKGDRAERGLVKMLLAAGVAAERTPMSGAVRSTRFGGGYDVRIPFRNTAMRAEVKHHANGFRRLYKWLLPVDLVIVKSDYNEPLAILPLKKLIEIAKAEGVPLTRIIADRVAKANAPRTNKRYRNS